jgi:hypothetical protein
VPRRKPREGLKADMSSDKQHAQQLLNHLAPDQIAAVIHLMEVMLDPVSRKLANAPIEDEEISEDEEQAARVVEAQQAHSTRGSAC